VLRRETVLGHGVALSALLGFVLLLTDRGPFAWAVAGATFIAVVVGDTIHRRATAGRGRWD